MTRFNKKKLYYLASPFSHSDDTVCWERFKEAEQYTADMLEGGYNVYSPIVYNYELAKTYMLPTDWTFWAGVDRRMLKACDECLVLCISGWQESKGVQAEIRYARRLGKAVHYIEVVSNEITYA